MLALSGLCDSTGLLFYNNIAGLQTLRAALDRELDDLTLFKGAVAIAANSRKMNKNVISTFARDETITLTSIEPLDRTDVTFRHCILPPSGLKRY